MGTQNSIVPKSFFDDLEKENGVPIVIFRWGYRKVKFEGKTYLVALTKDEAERPIRRSIDPNKEIDELQADAGYCITINKYDCTPTGGCHLCEMVPLQFGFVCECRR